METPRSQSRIASADDSDRYAASEGSEHNSQSNKGPKRRHATVYDAVAGKVSYSLGPQEEPAPAPAPTPRHPRAIRYHTKQVPLAPDEVLFRRKDAPQRYMENDIYYAHERQLLQSDHGVLPDSDLLKAIHGYTSAFYSAMRRKSNVSDDRDVNGRSMDETALLAFGILLEEAGKEVLGRRGDLVFTEGGDDAPAQSADQDEVTRGEDNVVGYLDVKLQRGPKRRKVASGDDA